MKNSNKNMKFDSEFDVVGYDYEEFLRGKEFADASSGFDIELKELNENLFDWQKVLVRWALRRGRAALFEDCGLGKTIQQLEWARHVSLREKAPVLIFAPLAVSEQTRQEGAKFGIGVTVCRDQDDVVEGINITNYEKFHKFDPSAFCGAVVDESSILKSYTGIFRNEVIEKFGSAPFRLACTATPSPNDYMELGNHAEFLGIMSRSEMLSMFFINDTGDTQKWRLKGHVRDNVFWSWLASWAVMIGKPSDLGYDDDGFILPKLTYHEHMLPPPSDALRRDKGFFLSRVVGMDERREVRRETVETRCRYAADLVNGTGGSWVIWCGLNAEGDLLEKLIDGAVQVAGRHPDEVKSERMLRFANEGGVLVTKPKIAGHGMNWQVCDHVLFVGLNDSWEDLYQAVRRVWRFGQKCEVRVHIVLDEREGTVLENVRSKDARALKMIGEMVGFTKELTKREIHKAGREYVNYNPREEMEVPIWLRTN